MVDEFALLRRQGYVVFPALLQSAVVTPLQDDVLMAFETRRDACRTLQGFRMGHLKFCLGDRNQVLWEALEATGLIARLRAEFGISEVHGRGNLNLPGSRRQVFHRDGTDDSLILNVPLVDVDANGPIQMACSPLGEAINTRRFFLKGYHRETELLTSRVGDVLLRTRAGWHRGTENHTTKARAMVGFRLLRGGPGAGAIRKSGFSGDVEILGNVYPRGLYGKLQERIDALMPTWSKYMKYATRFAMNLD